MKKVAIVDDETPARNLIKEYLADYESLIVVGEANNGVDAIQLIQDVRPDIVFLDIQMPGMTGFEVIRQIDVLPTIVFSTAFDQYALDAFEVNAIDYLLKPYTKERFARAVDKALARGHAHAQNIQALARDLLSRANTSYLSKILVTVRNKMIALDVSDIHWIEAEGDYSRLVTNEKRYLSNYGIGRIVEKLDPQVFIRVHRSAIVNIHSIREMHRLGSGYELKLTNGDRVRVSRSYAPTIRNLTL